MNENMEAVVKKLKELAEENRKTARKLKAAGLFGFGDKLEFAASAFDYAQFVVKEGMDKT